MYKLDPPSIGIVGSTAEPVLKTTLLAIKVWSLKPGGLW